DDRSETLLLLAGELASNIAAHPHAEGVVVATLLWTADEVEAVRLEARVRGAGGTQLPLASTYADDYGVAYEPDGYTAWVVYGNGSDRSGELIAALSDRSDRSAPPEQPSMEPAIVPLAEAHPEITNTVHTAAARLS
ncbi:hypothetical protein, partial [Nocardia farcinica]